MPRKAAPKRKEPETTKDEEPKVEEETKKEEPAKKPRRGKNAKNDVKEEEKKEEPKKEEPKEEAKPKAQRGKRGAAAKKEEPKEEEKDDSEEKEEKEEPKPKRGKKAAPKKGEKKEEEKKEEKTEEKPKEEEKKAPSPKKGGRRGAKAAANKKEEPKEEEKKEEEKKEEEKKEDEKEEEKPKKGGKRGAKAAKKEEKEEAEPASKKPKRAAATKKKAEADDEEEGEGEEGAEGSTAATSGETDFTTPKKKDDELKIISWNIAGWKAILGKGFKEYVKSEDPDVICIQETKVAANTVKEDFLPGYYAHFNGCTKQPGYAGTGMFSKVKPIAWTDGIGIADHDEEGRVITAEFDKFYLVNTYIPNSGRGLKDLDYRKKWDKDFLEYLKKLDAKKPVIWTGDLNVAHEEIDLKNPKTNKNKTAGFSDAEREGFSAVLKAGFVDALRKLYPKQEGFYTFWTYMGNARGKDIGWRLDYFVVSQRAIDKMSDTYRRPLIMGSDHCPIGIHIALK